ncbi:MAG: glycosyltransferase family 2 protein [Bacteroidaceae bacterium]|nr:glycosyltransferase family 2 protein [Bacteroidaceae bacterium]
MSKISILCAVYNAEPFLPQCINSLRNQTLRDIQIICIDDCSTDHSLQIINEFAAEDNRIIVIQTPQNEGQAAARNRGIEIADGEFITMVDADDWLAPDALEQAWDVAQQHPETDAVLFDLVKVWPDRAERYPSLPLPSLSGKDAMRLSLDWQIHGLYIIRAEIQRRWPYDDTARLYSDDNTTRLHYLSSREVRACKGIYYYRQHENSCTQQISMRHFDSLLAQQHMRQMLVEEGTEKSILDYYEKYRWLQLVDNCYYLYLNRKHFTHSEKRQAREMIADARKSIDKRALPKSIKLKFGYKPCLSFRTFMLQERLYFFLRQITGRL